MPVEVRTRAFEPFFTTKAKGSGTGLGLATVHAIVDQAGGTIELHSDEGAGTTFSISLPAGAGADAGQAEAVGPEVPPGNDELILVAEDEPGVRELTSRILRNHGYQVVAADNASHALDLCRSGTVKPRLLLTDVIMPGMSGKDLAQAVTEHLPGTPVVYMSGYSHEIIAHQGVLEPGVVLVEKPFTEHALLQAVQSALQRRHDADD
jgi:CheY-like chemotaxis protein